ncbi:MAG: hypothetical protein PWQ26_326, partial [Thermotoga sp.]|nr:hypothetical protein [Thermotoga sp.]
MLFVRNRVTVGIFPPFYYIPLRKIKT